MENQKKKFYLKWPWNVVVYILLVIFLRILAIPAILALMAWNKKQQPDGPAEGYCLQRTRQRLTYLLWAALCLFIGAAMVVFFVMTFQESKGHREMEDYVGLVVSGVLGPVAILGGFYLAFVGIRDTFFPEKSTLAKSIRSQLPYPDEAPPVKELFAMVDSDIKANGMWFDRVAVGNEWVLGDEANLISRIRVVLRRDEIQHRRTGRTTTTTRILQVYIMDDRRQVHISDLKHPNELPMLIDCLKLRAPDAEFGDHNEYADYCGMSDDEWEKLERDYRARKTKREAEAAQAAQKKEKAASSGTADQWTFTIPDKSGQKPADPHPPKLILFSASGAGQGHDRFHREDVEVGADGIIDGSYKQVDLTLPGGYLWCKVQAGDQLDGRCTVTATWPDGATLRYYTAKTTPRQAAAWLLDYYDGKLQPGGADWQDITKKLNKK